MSSRVLVLPAWLTECHIRAVVTAYFNIINQNKRDKWFRMKSVKKMVQSHWQSEGKGARVRRSIGRLASSTLFWRGLEVVIVLFRSSGTSILSCFWTSLKETPRTGRVSPIILTGALRQSATSWRESSHTRTLQVKATIFTGGQSKEIYKTIYAGVLTVHFGKVWVGRRTSSWEPFFSLPN